MPARKMIVPFFVMLSTAGAWPGFAWPSPRMVLPLRPWAASRARRAARASALPCYASFLSQSAHVRRLCSA